MILTLCAYVCVCVSVALSHSKLEHGAGFFQDTNQLSFVGLICMKKLRIIAGITVCLYPVIKSCKKGVMCVCVDISVFGQVRIVLCVLHTACDRVDDT